MAFIQKTGASLRFLPCNDGKVT